MIPNGRAPHWGPDHRIVFERGGDLWIRNTLGDTRQLTSTPHHEVQPAWSPLGDWIAFASDEAGTLDIWVVSSRGGTRVRVTTDKHDAVHPSWSSDGSALVFITQPALGPDTIWMASGLPDFTVSVEQQPWGAIKQMYR